MIPATRTRMRTERRRKNILILLLAAAIFAPGAALSALALRAADRESFYVERRLEGALVAEVGLAARRVEQLIEDVRGSLARDVKSKSSPERWFDMNAMVETVFELEGDNLSVFSPYAGRERNFRESFGGFLTDGERLPVYDLVTRIYRIEPEVSEDGPETQGRMFSGVTGKSSVPAGAGISRQIAGSRMETDYAARDDAFRQATDEGFEIMSRNVVPMKADKPAAAENEAQLEIEAAARVPDNVPYAENLQPAPAQAKIAQKPPADIDGERSKTVSKSKSFAELSGESDGGLLPLLSEDGLEVLFWTRSPGGGFEGCTLRMDIFRDMVADALPDILSEARILTVLDENGVPVVAPPPDSASIPDWRRPFAAREISPALPRWEVGAWLTDPGIFAARANYARTTAWILTAVLIAVMLLGSAVAMRALSYEMKLASQKTTFVANVSHELKTPLTSIRLYAELLLSGKQNDEERRREYLRTMMSETDRLSHLIDNVLSFSRRGREKLKTGVISLSGVARETVAQLEPHLVKLGFSVSCEASVDLTVRGDREALKQVVMNLVSNAEKYSGEGREITVECKAAGGFARVDISDRGAGVPPGMAERIFQEFVRGDDSLSAPRSGTGLGLSIARGIARKHGGDVVYSPRDGGGSVFSLLLPEWRRDR
jgi:signal transduction histidine kinase